MKFKGLLRLNLSGYSSLPLGPRQLKIKLKNILFLYYISGSVVPGVTLISCIHGKNHVDLRIIMSHWKSFIRILSPETERYNLFISLHEGLSAAAAIRVNCYGPFYCDFSAHVITSFCVCGG